MNLQFNLKKNRRQVCNYDFNEEQNYKISKCHFQVFKKISRLPQEPSSKWSLVKELRFFFLITKVKIRYKIVITKVARIVDFSHNKFFIKSSGNFEVKCNIGPITRDRENIFLFNTNKRLF